MAFLDETGLAELWSLIQGEDAKAPKVATGSYTGTGTNGTSNQCSLTFGFAPKFLVVSKSGGATAYHNDGCIGAMYWVTPSTGAVLITGTGNYAPGVTVSGNTISWSSSQSADYQLNRSGTTYNYLAVG